MWLIVVAGCGSSSVSLGSPDPDESTDDSGHDRLPGEEASTSFGCDPLATDAEVDELEMARLVFRCAGGATPEHWRLASAPAGSSFDEATATLTWQTDLASAGVWAVQVDAVKGDRTERAQATIAVADAYDERGNEEPDPLTYTHEYGLPVFHLSVNGVLPEAGTKPVTVTYGGHEFTGAEAQYRGASSSYYPKRSYRVDFAPDDEFEDHSEGFPNRRSVVLTSTFDDNSYFRQKMCFDIWNLLNPARPIATTFAVLYLNGEYVGLYLLGDHIDGEWFENFGYPEEGNLYKSVDHSANFYSTYGGAKSSWHSGYEKKEGVEGDWSDIDAFVEFVATSSNDDFDAGIGQIVDLEDIYDWWAMVVFAEADDSGGKNAYLYNDPAAPLFRFEPWDLNHSLGQTWQTEREPATYAYDFTSVNGLFLRLLNSPTHGSVMRERFADARSSVLSRDEMQALIDSYVARIDRSAQRDWREWEDEYRSYGGWSWRTDWTDHHQEVAYVRDWIDDRWSFIEGWDP